VARFHDVAPRAWAAADAVAARWPDDYSRTKPVSWLYYNLGFGYAELGDFPEALAVIAAGRALDERLDRHLEYGAMAWDRAAEVCHALGDLEAALEWYLKGLAWREDLVAAVDKARARVAQSPSFEGEQPVSAKARAITLITRLVLPFCYAGVSELYRDWGDPDAAADWQGKAQTIWEQSEIKNLEADTDYILQDLAKKEEVLGPGHPGTILPYQRLARAYRDRGDPAAARDALFKVLAAKEKALGPDHLGTALTYHQIAQASAGLGDKEAALTWFGQALRIRLDQAPDRRETAATLSAARQVHADLGRPESFDDWLGI
jgi:tetratricopeptide (TPR) repeat protein